MIRQLVASSLLVALTAQASGGARLVDRMQARFRLPNTASAGGGSSDPSNLFVIASDTGAGMGTPCSGAAVTAIGGQSVTFSRGSQAYCFLGPIAGPYNIGDLVLLTTNTPRVQYEPDKRSGRLGIFNEPQDQNAASWASDFTNVIWTKAGSGVAAPTITAAAALAPNNTLTAQRVQIPATSGINTSFLYQSVPGPGGGNTATGSWFIKGNGQSGTLNVSLTGSGITDTITYTNGVWTRPSFTQFVPGTPLFVIGNSGTQASQDFFLWNTQCQSGPYASSPIPTTTAAAARSADVWTVAQADLNSAGVANSNGCFGADIYQVGPYSALSALANNGFGCGLMGGDSGGRFPFLTSTQQVRAFDGANQNSSNVVLPSTQLTDQLNSFAGRWLTSTGINSWSPLIGGDGVLQTTYNNSALGSGAVRVGLAGSGCTANDPMWLTRIRFDTYANGCH